VQNLSVGGAPSRGNPWQKCNTHNPGAHHHLRFHALPLWLILHRGVCHPSFCLRLTRILGPPRVAASTRPRWRLGRPSQKHGATPDLQPRHRGDDDYLVDRGAYSLSLTLLATEVNDDPGCPTVTDSKWGMAESHATTAVHAQMASAGLSVVGVKDMVWTFSPFRLLGNPGMNDVGLLSWLTGRRKGLDRLTPEASVMGGLPLIALALATASSGTQDDLPNVSRLYGLPRRWHNRRKIRTRMRECHRNDRRLRRGHRGQITKIGRWGYILPALISRPIIWVINVQNWS